MKRRVMIVPWTRSYANPRPKPLGVGHLVYETNHSLIVSMDDDNPRDGYRVLPKRTFRAVRLH